MNLILFDDAADRAVLPPEDPRTAHIRNVLRRRPGETFDCGVIDGPRGKATVKSDNQAGLALSFTWGAEPAPPAPIRLLVGLPRPQTVRKILREVTAMGVANIVFFQTNRNEPSYGQSSLWQGDEVRRLLIQGAEQAFCTRLPKVAKVEALSEALNEISECRNRIALDNYEAHAGLNAHPFPPDTCTVIAIGSERGWSDAERSALREAGFTLAHLGQRVLRTETACIAALALARARLGFYD